MAVHKHPIAHQWIRQTLVPFLLFAFVSALPYPADISTQIQRSIDFCLQKPDHPSDGDDLTFERIFMAIMHRRKNLAPDLEMVVDNLEPLAKYLIRRAQLKGPYDLLERTAIASNAWVENERHRLSTVIVELEGAKDDLRPPVRPPITQSKSLPADTDIDPRLIHAKQGHFTTAHFPEQLSADDDTHYRRRNREFEEYSSRMQQISACSHAVLPQSQDRSDAPPNRGYANARTAYGSPYQQGRQQASIYTIEHHIDPVRQPTPVSQCYSQTQIRTSPSLWSKCENTRLPQSDSVGRDTFAQPQPILRMSPHVNSLQNRSPAHPALQQQPTRSFVPDRQHLHIPTKTSSPLHDDSRISSTASHMPETMANHDFARPRGTDWSAMVQQRARDIAAKLTAHERDTMAQGIMQRRETIARKASELSSSSNNCGQLTQAQDMPAEPHSAQSTIEHVDDTDTRISTISPASYATRSTKHAQSHSSWSTVSPQDSARASMPTLEQARGRYHPSQQRFHAASPVVPGTELQAYAQPVEQVSLMQRLGEGHAMRQQRELARLTGNGAPVDALQQLRDAAGWRDGVVTQLWEGEQRSRSGILRQDAVMSRMKREGNGDVEMDGV